MTEREFYIECEAELTAEQICELITDEYKVGCKTNYEYKSHGGTIEIVDWFKFESDESDEDYGKLTYTIESDWDDHAEEEHSERDIAIENGDKIWCLIRASLESKTLLEAKLDWLGVE